MYARIRCAFSGEGVSAQTYLNAYVRTCVSGDVDVKCTSRRRGGERASWKAVHARRERDRNITITWNKRVGSSPSFSPPFLSLSLSLSSMKSIVLATNSSETIAISPTTGFSCRCPAFWRRLRRARRPRDYGGAILVMRQRTRQ